MWQIRKNNMRSNSSECVAAKLWNNLDSNFKNIPKVKSFRNKIKSSGMPTLNKWSYIITKQTNKQNVGKMLR